MLGGVGGLLVAAGALAWLLLTLLKRVPQRGVSWRFGLANLRRRAARVEPADRRAGARPDGAAAADGRARRPAARLAREPAAGCAEPVPRQRAARAGRRRARVARATIARRRRSSSRWCAAGSSRSTARRSTRRATPTRARAGSPSASSTCRGPIALPVGNRVVQGTFWSPQARGADAGISLEEGIAQTLGVKLGDRADVRRRRHPRHARRSRACARSTGTASASTSSRCSRPGALDDLPATYIAAFRAPEGNTRVAVGTRAALSEHPGDRRRAKSCARCRAIIDRVARAVEFVFLFTLAGGLLVLQAAIASTQDERKFDAAIVRTLGASQRAAAKRAGGRIPAARRARRAARARPARRRSAGRSPIACSTFRSPANPLVWLYGIAGGALAVHARRLARHARDGARAAARGAAPARCWMSTVRRSGIARPIT